ncbi:MAG TPA: hypothetical protein VGD88_13655 [Opitutaceae bacterium]
MKLHRLLVIVVLGAKFLTIGVGCQTAGGDVRERDRHAERFLNQRPEAFSLLDRSDSDAQRRSPDF